MKQKLNEVLRPLGLKEPEILVYYKLLAYDHLGMSGLSRETKIARTSLYTILSTLEKRDLVRQIKVSQHKEWQAASPDELQTIISRSFSLMEEALPELTQRHEYKSLHKKGTVEFIAGQKTKTRGALRTLYGNLGALSKHEHVYFIEGLSSQEYKFGEYGTSYVKSWKNLLTNGSFALHGILAQSSLDKILNFDEDTLKIFLNNPIQLTVFDDTDLNFDCDIIISREQVFFAHPPQNTAAIINYKHTTDAMIRLFKVLESSGKKIDFQTEVRKRLGEG